MEFSEWPACYPSNWIGLLVDPNHPAKFSSKLIRRIYDHLKTDRVFDNPGIVVDPFAGVASGALFANRVGIDWIGVEIEAENVLSGQRNLDFQREKFGKFYGGKWGESGIVLGDSRFLESALSHSLVKYSRVAAVISSPPFLQSTGGKGKNTDGAIDSALLKRHSAGNAAVNYGGASGQIAGLSGNDFEAVLSSVKTGTPGPDTGGFWRASADIIAQVRRISDPDTRVVWVTKGYVKGGVLIDFPDQWRQLCEASGFVTEHIHRAPFMKNRRVQLDIFGDEIEYKTESKSFFRRVVEKKHGIPPIDFETILCMKTY